MVAMIVRHRVANYESWRKVFDSMHDIRAAHSWTGSEVYRDATDPNLVTVVNHVADVESAKRYGGSQELRDGMAKAGVISTPDITFLSEAY